MQCSRSERAKVKALHKNVSCNNLFLQKMIKEKYRTFLATCDGVVLQNGHPQKKTAKIFGRLEHSHLEERLLDQAQVWALQNPLF